MKILLFTLEYPPFYGGVANYYGNMAKYWPQAGGLFVLHNNDSRLISDKLPFLKWLPAIWRLWRMIKREKIEHILVGHILPLGTAVYLLSFFKRTPYSVFLHGMDLALPLRSARKRWLVKKILTRAKSIICGNAYTERLTKEFLGGKSAGKIKVVNPGVKIGITHNLPAGQAGAQRITQIKEKYNLEDKIILLSVGRLVKRKGFDMVLESLPEVLKKASNLVYVIVGRGEELENLKFKIKNLKLKNDVILITNADDEQKWAWYGACDIFIMPARDIDGDFEGFGVVYLEANLAGKPVIAGDSGGVRDAVVDGLNSLLVNPESVSDIAATIIKLAQDKNLRKKLGEQGRERAMREFNWEEQARKIYDILILNNKF